MSTRGPRGDETEPAHAVEAERHRLVLVAYRICGCFADAEDVVQQAVVEWLRLEHPVDNVAGWLTTTTVRRAIDTLRARQRGVEYVGPWLPEPLVEPAGVSPDESLVQHETLTTAFLVLAEALTPPQRAVIVLRSLDYSHAQIAHILGVSPGASRQHQLRGTRRLHAAAPASAPDADVPPLDGSAPDGTAAVAGELLEAFLSAAREGDLERLTALLHADVRAYQDGGGTTKAARRVLVGPRNVSRFVVGVASLHHARRTVARATVNGAPGAIITLSGAMHVLSLEVHEGRIHRLFDVCNPRKHTTVDRLSCPRWSPRASPPAQAATSGWRRRCDSAD